MSKTPIARVQRRKWVKAMWSVVLGKTIICTYDDRHDCNRIAAAINEAILAAHFAAIQSRKGGGA